MRVFVFLCLVVGVFANHQNCTTVGCADLCNFQGVWVTDLTNSYHGYCVCNDMHYSRETGDHDDGLTSHLGIVNCGQRRKSLLTAFVLHFNPITAPFAAAHWYLWHVGIAIPQMLFGLFGGGLFFSWWVGKSETKGQSACTILSCCIFGVWWFVDLMLFIFTTHFKDEHGEELYAW
jgi:hypothetical protein